MSWPSARALLAIPWSLPSTPHPSQGMGKPHLKFSLLGNLKGKKPKIHSCMPLLWENFLQSTTMRWKIQCTSEKLEENRFNIKKMSKTKESQNYQILGQLNLKFLRKF